MTMARGVWVATGSFVSSMSSPEIEPFRCPLPLSPLLKSRSVTHSIRDASGGRVGMITYKILFSLYIRRCPLRVPVQYSNFINQRVVFAQTQNRHTPNTRWHQQKEMYRCRSTPMFNLNVRGDDGLTDPSGPRTRHEEVVGFDPCLASPTSREK